MWNSKPTYGASPCGEEMSGGIDVPGDVQAEVARRPNSPGEAGQGNRSTHVDSKEAAAALVQQALLLLRTEAGALEEVEQFIRKAEGLAGNDKGLRGLVLHARSQFHWKRCETQQTRTCLEEARSLLEEAGDQGNLAKVFDSLGVFFEHVGDWSRALSYYCLSLSKKARSGDICGIAITLGNLGRFQLRANKPDLALACLSDDLDIVKTLGDTHAQTAVKINIGQALTDLDRLKEAREILNEALALSRKRGWKRLEAYALKDLARTLIRLGDLRGATRIMDDAAQLLPDLSSYARGQILLAQGDLHAELRDWERARRAFQKARKVFASIDARREETLASQGLIRIAAETGDLSSPSEVGGATRLMTSAEFDPWDWFQETLRTLDRWKEERVPRAIGPYKVRSLVGGGAFANVYRAFDEREPSPQVDLAVKVLRLDSNMGTRRRKERFSRFRREYEILRHVFHPNVVRLIDFCAEPFPYLVEEFLPGGDLRRFTRKDSLLAFDETIGVVRGILEGLAALHRQGIVHRDLKPGNVLLRDNGQPVIVDFGLSRMFGLTALTLGSEIMGTLPYMAPEQLRGGPVDKRADVYAFGVVLFQLLSGSLPRCGDSLCDAVNGSDRVSLTRLKKLHPNVSRVAFSCATRCLQKDPDKRYPSAEAILEDLHEVLSGSDPQSDPPTKEGRGD